MILPQMRTMGTLSIARTDDRWRVSSFEQGRYDIDRTFDTAGGAVRFFLKSALPGNDISQRLRYYKTPSAPSFSLCRFLLIPVSLRAILIYVAGIISVAPSLSCRALSLYFFAKSLMPIRREFPRPPRLFTATMDFVRRRVCGSGLQLAKRSEEDVH